MLNHVFKIECQEYLSDIFDGCDSLAMFEERLRQLKGFVEVDNFVEHGFQALVEALIRYYRWIPNYYVSTSTERESLIHGHGVNNAGGNCTVGVFCVNDIDKPLTANGNHLTTFWANSIASPYDVEASGTNGMFVFSNAKQVHEKTIEQFVSLGQNKNIVFILREKVEAYLTPDFWAFFQVGCNIVRKEIKKKILRKHQKEAVTAAISAGGGKILLPTGTGKSLIEAEIIVKYIGETKTPVCLISTPRIVLTYQLIHMISEYLMSRGIDAQYINLNSGNINADEIKKAMTNAGLISRDIPSTTSSKALQEIYDKNYGKCPIIIGATYHSSPKILETNIHVNVALYDEAHNLVQNVGRFSNGFKRDVHSIEVDHKFFLTATEAFTASDEGSGMQNKELYGETVYSCSPKDMIDAGEIVPPFIHIVRVEEYQIRKSLQGDLEIGSLSDEIVERNVELASTVVAAAYNEHKERIKSNSAEPDAIGAKLLVVCKGEPALAGFFASEVMKDFRAKNPSVKFYSISTSSGAYLNGEEIRGPGGNFKEKFMIALKSLQDSDEAIILHIDMLGEGIDVPGITGIMAFRDLGPIKSSQTLGRAMRLCDTDREKLYEGKIQPCDFDKMRKPHAWVIIPSYSWSQADSRSRITRIVLKMRNELGYMPFENVNGSPADGRIEQFHKDDKGMFGDRPEEAIIIHEVEKTDYYQFIDMFDDEILSGGEKSIEIAKVITNIEKKRVVIHQQPS